MAYQKKGRVTLLTKAQRALQAGHFPPAPPKFPLSNYTYGKVCEKLRRAAAAGDVETVRAYRPKGTANTYARATVGYRDLLLSRMGG